MITGKIRARIEHCCAKQSVLAAFIGVHSEGDAPLRRPPATRFCASLVETWLAAAEITSGPDSGFLTSAAEAVASVFKAVRGKPAQEPRHAPRLRAAGRPVQGARRGGVPPTREYAPRRY